MHQPVMRETVLTHIMTDPNGCYLDATFGRGGHSTAILSHLGGQGRLLVLDRDPAAVAVAHQLADTDHRVVVSHRPFAHLQAAVAETFANDVGVLQGVLFDLGVSSPQLDEAERGFSFHHAGPLDMRMDTTQSWDAADWLAEAEESEIADILYNYGDERASRRIARAIVAARVSQPLTQTAQLAELVIRCLGRQPGKKHPATRTFQAIRMHVNQELPQLSAGLEAAIKALAPGGRLVVISFHSIEDRIVKQCLRQYAKPPPPPADPRLPQPVFKPSLRLVAKHLPTPSEISDNRRARSAVLRVAEKVEDTST